jgi:hypothetical protein
METCGKLEGHPGYCVQMSTLARHGQVPRESRPPEEITCGLRPGHAGHHSSIASIAQKRARKRERWGADAEYRERKLREQWERNHPGVPFEDKAKRHGAVVFTREQRVTLKAWIGCENPAGCPFGLGGKAMGRNPAYFAWDHVDPSLKNHTRRHGQLALTASNNMSFEAVTQVFATERVQVLCLLCHADKTYSNADHKYRRGVR